ncbi:MAG: hypothetical protein ACXWEF_06885, partial [Solirubrobacterales bacterium]
GGRRRHLRRGIGDGNACDRADLGSMIGRMDNWFVRLFVKVLALWCLILIPTEVVLARIGASQSLVGLVVLALFIVTVLIAMHMYEKARPQSF